MLIREYQATDREGCIDIFKSNIPVFFTPQELAEFKSWLDEQLQEKSSPTEINRYYVLEEENNVIACGGFHINTLTSQATMTWGMVANRWHRKGFGKKLLEYRIYKIKALHPAAIILLDTTQHSYKFFETLGFAVTKITNDYYAQGLDRYDMLLSPAGLVASKRSIAPGDLPDD
ncbi:GNAT family N-acetyltransferase [Rhodocytophaga rosea]|uniref:GNAT family N-acetyltransferase n=1 Tax=Rhodocytophaga rosea TaxID=2704465 RepID=A0A6C0GI76_9BACT|nr:GNAT family N-acetyltransferase [Rhodocytophaga rosea]QHT67647.1 GNAT family N-acetyltransferase [Rhodocytophaga rosea]